MRLRRFGGYAALIYAAMILSGCVSQATATARGPQDAMPSLAEGAAGSWMDSKASSQDLLYIAAGAVNGAVYVYSYPEGRLVGTLTGFLEPFGECADSAGDVFVVAYANSSMKSSTIYEYAHGGTTPIATLSDPNVAFGCAVDPTTGNLAASGDGVAIYQHATGNPTMYSSNFAFHYCGYDDEENLYLSAGDDSSYNEAQLIRLARGSSEFEQINLNEPLYKYTLWPSVQWDGKHMTVLSNPYRKPLLIYRLRISGSSATVVGSTEVSSSKNNYKGQTWIKGDTIVGTGYAKRAYVTAFLWRYPAGGAARRQITKAGGVRGPDVSGVTVSVGRRQ
jgi:hypothetical protein